MAAEILTSIKASAPWLKAVDELAARALSRSEAQTLLLTEYLATAGEATGDGIGDLESDRIRAAYLLLHHAESRAATLRARLGLDPLSRARLGKDVAAGAVDIARLMASLAEEGESGAG